MDLVSLTFWLLATYAFFSRTPFIIYLFFAAFPFGAVAAIPPALVGGVTLTPTWVTAGLLIAKVLILRPQPLPMLAPLANVRQMGLLAACTVYGVVSAYFLPRLFAGTPVIPMRAIIHVAVPLFPTPANITQTLYLVLTTFSVLAIYQLARHEPLRRHVLNGILLGGVFAVLTGAADMATAAVGAGAVLAPFRTATYALLTGAEVLSVRRVVGLMPEASAFSGLCMGFAAPLFFLRHTYQTRLTRGWIAPITFALLAVMIGMSSSSTGYVGIAVLVLLILLHGFTEFARGRATGQQSLAVVYAAGALLLALMVLRPDAFGDMADRVNELIFRKSLTGSYAERGMWSQVTMDAFWASDGLGVGLGSARASSWVVAVLGNIGAVGGALLFTFIALMFFARPKAERQADAAAVTGAKYAVIPLLAMASLAATSVAFDLMTGVLFGLIGAMSWRPMQQALPYRAQVVHRPNARAAEMPARSMGRSS